MNRDDLLDIALIVIIVVVSFQLGLYIGKNLYSEVVYIDKKEKSSESTTLSTE